MYDRLLRIFEGFLGDSARGASENGQCQFNCPFCNSGKKNLEVSLSRGIYNSWCCQGRSGRLTSLIKEFGNDIIMNQYLREIQSLKESRLYQVQMYDNISNIKNLELPQCCKPIMNKNGYNHYESYKYCHDRGITDDMIRKYNICYTLSNCEDKKLQNRIVFPSYDKYNSLNYWVARTYRDSKWLTKYYIPNNVSKRDVIFNERFINWDGEVRLVEGIFDAMVVPSSVPIMGKKLNNNFKLYNEIVNKGSHILLIPDKDAIYDWMEIKHNLQLSNRRLSIRMVDWNKFQDGYCKDVSDVFERHNKQGVINLMKNLD
jgi:hypothetical protein